MIVTQQLVIPMVELEFRATTGSGPGGQHVNRSATRVELRWNAKESASLQHALGDAHHARVLERLHTRLDSDGSLRLVAGEHRSQRRNRDAAVARLASILRTALADPTPRKATRPTRGSVRRRLEGKRHRSDVKRDRTRRDFDS